MDNAQYWSAAEEACFQGAQAALDKLVRASAQVGRKRKVDEKAEAERIARRSREAQRSLEGRLRTDSRRDRILIAYALSFGDGAANVFAKSLRREMSGIDLRGLPWGARSSTEEIDTTLHDTLEMESKELIWRFASRTQPVAEVVAQWEREFSQRRETTRVAAEALADEVEVWLVKRSIVDANAKKRSPGSKGTEG